MHRSAVRGFIFLIPTFEDCPSLPGNAAGATEESSGWPILRQQRETDCLSGTLLDRLVAAVLIEVRCRKPGIGRVHLNSRFAQFESELYGEHIERSL